MDTRTKSGYEEEGFERKLRRCLDAMCVDLDQEEAQAVNSS